jgi:hypothetical protein
VKATTTVSANCNRAPLVSRATSYSSGSPTSEARQGFCYTGLGEEERRVAAIGDGADLDGCNAAGDARVVSSYDAVGHADVVDNQGDGAGADVDYLYDADGSVIARTKTATDGTKTTRFFERSRRSASRNHLCSLGSTERVISRESFFTAHLKG